VAGAGVTASGLGALRLGCDIDQTGFGGNDAAGEYSVVLGGQRCQVDAGAHFARAGGKGAEADQSFSDVFGLGLLETTNNSVGYRREVGLLKRTTNNTPVEMELGNDKATYGYMTLWTNSAATYQGTVTGYDTAGNVVGWVINGTIKNVAGTVTLPVHNETAIGADAGLSGAAITVAADNTNKCLKITVTGVNGHTIDWAAELRQSEIQRY
jgi:hypothetical protein